MSCNGGSCTCGSGCKCGSSGGCGMYPDIEKTTTATLVVVAGVAPPVQMHSEEAEKSTGAEGGNGCKCSPCKCDPCNC